MDNFDKFLVHIDSLVVSGYETGIGCYGVVYRSTINGAPCVVKKLHDILTGVRGNQPVPEDDWRALVQRFRKEIELLSQQRHPNIVQFLGIYMLGGDPRDICLVMEELDIDLTHFIATNAEQVVPMEIKLKILMDTACGVSHLHSNGIIHRDLNASNVLLASDLRAKVADLGVSRVVDTTRLTHLTNAPGAQDYMPPETSGSQPVYNHKLDCFSFGHLALYLCLQVYPSPRELSEETIKLVGHRVKGITHGVQIVKRKEWFDRLGYDHPLYQVIAMCLRDKPENRWEMDKIRKEMSEIPNKPPPKLINLLKENEDLKQTMLEVREVNKQLQSMIQRKQDTIQSYREEISQLRIIHDKPDWVVDREEIETTQEILGKGAWSEVKVGVFRGTRVAVKCLFDVTLSDYNLHVFSRQMHIGSLLRHPNLLQFIGAVRSGKPMILSEIIPTSLCKELEKKAMTRPQILTIARDVASALNYLHLWKPHPILHRDVSSANCLLESSGNAQWKAKLSGFISANFLHQINTVAPGNPAYAAPETRYPDLQSPAMDVYSFSILLVEMVIHRQPSPSPFERKKQIEAVQWPSVRELVDQCTADDQNTRPTMKEVLKYFNKM